LRASDSDFNVQDSGFRVRCSAQDSGVEDSTAASFNVCLSCSFLAFVSAFCTFSGFRFRGVENPTARFQFDDQLQQKSDFSHFSTFRALGLVTCSTLPLIIVGIYINRGPSQVLGNRHLTCADFRERCGWFGILSGCGFHNSGHQSYFS